MNRHLQIRGPLIQAAQPLKRGVNLRSARTVTHICYTFSLGCQLIYLEIGMQRNVYGHQILIKSPLIHKLLDRLFCIIIAFTAQILKTIDAAHNEPSTYTLLYT